MSATHKLVWYERRKRKAYHDQLHRNWAQIIAATAKIGGYGESELDWDSYSKIRAELISEAKKEKIKRTVERKNKQEEKKKKKEKKKKEMEEQKRLQEILEIIKEKMVAEKAEKWRPKSGKVKMKITAKSNRFVKQRLTKVIILLLFMFSLTIF
jgi:Fe2+ transport system protein B